MFLDRSEPLTDTDPHRPLVPSFLCPELSPTPLHAEHPSGLPLRGEGSGQEATQQMAVGGAGREADPGAGAASPLPPAPTWTVDSRAEAPAQPFSLNKRDDVILVLSR